VRRAPRPPSPQPGLSRPTSGTLVRVHLVDLALGDVAGHPQGRSIALDVLTEHGGLARLDREMDDLVRPLVLAPLASLKVSVPVRASFTQPKPCVPACASKLTESELSASPFRLTVNVASPVSESPSAPASLTEKVEGGARKAHRARSDEPLPSPPGGRDSALGRPPAGSASCRELRLAPPTVQAPEREMTD
jgi:hypothetical protein